MMLGKIAKGTTFTKMHGTTDKKLLLSSNGTFLHSKKLKPKEKRSTTPKTNQNEQMPLRTTSANERPKS